MTVALALKEIQDQIKSIERRLTEVRGGGWGGEVNTGANVGVGGVGPYNGKVGVQLQFRNINAGSAVITVALDAPNNEVDIDVDPSQIDLNDLGDVNAPAPNNGDVVTWVAPPGEWQPVAPVGGGDVVGPGASTDHAIARWNGIGGALLQDSPLSILTDAPILFLNEILNAQMTIGVTINQGSADNEILAGKSSDVAHGITSRAETDTFFKFQKTQGDYGGLNIEGYQDTGGAESPLNLGGYTKASLTGMSATSVSAVTIQGIYCGGGTDRMPAPSNFIIAGFRTYDSSGNWRYKWQVDQEGDTWQLGGVSAGGNIDVLPADGASRYFRGYAHGNGVVPVSGLVFYRSRGTHAVPTINVAGDYVTGQEFWAYDGGAYRAISSFYCRVEAVVGANNISGYFQFFTRPAGAAAALTERMRIIGSGYVYIYSMRSGATQVAAGASAGELWKTNGHATLPDNVIMHGV